MLYVQNTTYRFELYQNVLKETINTYFRGNLRIITED